MKFFLTALYVLFVLGCSGKYDNRFKYNELTVDKLGNYEHNYEHNLSKKKYQCQLNDKLIKMTKDINSSKENKKKVLIYIHGGLNTFKSQHESLKKHFNDAVKDGYYPIFINWKSGAVTTLIDRYFHVRDGVDTQLKETIISSPFYVASDLLKGVAKIPESFVGQGINFYKTQKKQFSDFDERDINDTSKILKSENFYYTGKGNKKSLWEHTKYGIRQVVPGVTRLITTPLVEGLGSESWNIMLRRAKVLMYRQYDLANHGIGMHYEEDKIEMSCEKNSKYFQKNAPNGVVAQLMRALGTLHDKIEIMLVGHSMGGIVANDIVEEFPHLPYSKIIHMASADSVRNLMDSTVPVLDKNSSIQFYNLSLHPTNEEQEQSVGGIAPEGSLLIWLDDLFTSPETILDKRAGRWENIKWVFPFLKDKKNIYFKVFGLRDNYDSSQEDNRSMGIGKGNYSEKSDIKYRMKEEDDSEPINHGDFNDFKFWREEFYWGKK